MPKKDFHNHVALRVRWSECDAQGIVYYGRYMDYVEIGLAEYFRNLGHRLYDETQRAYFDTATVKITMEYKAPARVDEMLEVYTRVSKIGTTSLVTETEIYREGEEELLNRAETVYVDFDSASGASRAVPDELRALIGHFEEAGEVPTDSRPDGPGRP